ncbi:AP2 domain-containing protein [Blastomonas sp. CCH2-A2]|uniref:AP2 domain-containing protein n=1 Tax=Blastomonas sp. CCH2-A2 TaxID=1768788 RepID=UPI000AED2C4A|nr:AP2 domain-containing protein [Blastomonas sp. CCH2-A2]
MIGQSFSRLTVVASAGKDRKRNLLWQCQCSCGETTITAGYRLRSGETRSCGCLQRESVTERNASHGQSGTRLYIIWSNMRARCQDLSNPHYGARGIKVCSDWETFEPFYQWAQQAGYDDSLTIERINNDEGYSPANCRWATVLEQSKNKRPRKDHKLTADDARAIRRDHRPRKEVAAEYGVNKNHISRIKNGLRWADA